MPAQYMTFECTKWTGTSQTRDARHVQTVEDLARYIELELL
jgi:hypothetical protein